ncbi:transcriptional regulator, LacI family [Oscillibacter sp. PC13]|uniref:LacI family DNA-binding transcriptional regulator n=1 Tax=Oscillibacter sp. PC13 TaxID=1855299 RepID=UPI0008F00993|nr:LacI family DNA-binding transcriptional regulator [Oscillibacter sp. PC13]SFP37531.1 transcriptional regulator, LacI family [Oscillibacter sp. PC13]
MASTLKDVARLAGVSLTTASRVINNDHIHRVNPKTAKKVIEAAAELEYAPNEFARNLRKKQSSHDPVFTIGVLLTSANDSYDDSFFYDLLLGIQTEVANSGHILGFTHSFSDTSQTAVQQALLNNPVSGMILLGRMSADTLHFLRKNVKHLVYAGLNSLNQQFDEVVCDSFLCAKTAVRHLAANGRKQISFVGTAASSGSSMLLNEYRYDGYLDAMRELGLPVCKNLILDTPLSTEMAFQAMDRALEEGLQMDGCFCANDNCAIGVLKALHMHKKKVPQDVAVISIDDIDMAAYSRPMLSTIHIPRQEIGEYSVRLLADQIQNNRKYPIRMSLPFYVVVRESCGEKVSKKKTFIL